MTLPERREQRLVREFFTGAQSGFFVEVGANRPRQESQTWHLEQLGWTGVLIEPQPDLARDLCRARSAKVFAVACSSPENAGRRMQLHVAGALSALDRDRMAPGAQPERTIEVPVRTLDDVLTEAHAPVGFDLLSVDVEGHELEVLTGFDFARWRPRLVLLEDHVANLKKHRFLRAAGYRLVRRFENNGWYVPREATRAVTPRERWEIVRKYYLALPFRVARNASRAVRRRLRERFAHDFRPASAWVNCAGPRAQLEPSRRPLLRAAATGRSVAPTTISFPRNAWHNDKRCLRNFPRQ
jgi:FkbM family methyltransferase